MIRISFAQGQSSAILVVTLPLRPSKHRQGKEGYYNHPCYYIDYFSSTPLLCSSSKLRFRRRQKWCSTSTTLGRCKTVRKPTDGGYPKGEVELCMKATLGVSIWKHLCHNHTKINFFLLISLLFNPPIVDFSDIIKLFYQCIYYLNPKACLSMLSILH